jgi:hypothetical protein
MCTHRAERVSLILALASFAGLSGANDVREQPFQQRFKSADLVIVAVATSNNSEQRTYATLQVESVLKGQAEGIIKLLVKGDIVEFNPECCAAGARYLLLLNSAQPGYFVAVNGRFGVYRLDSTK